jgi:hypothetical protein
MTKEPLTTTVTITTATTTPITTTLETITRIVKTETLVTIIKTKDKKPPRLMLLLKARDTKVRNPSVTDANYTTVDLAQSNV